MTTPAPSVPNFIAGFGPQQSDMQSLWVNAAAFFQQRVIFRATQTTSATTLPSSGAITSVVPDNIIEDPYSGWSASGHHWIAPIAGWYQVTVAVWITAPGATQTILNVYVFTPKGTTNPTNGEPLVSVVMPNGTAGAEATWYCYFGVGDSVIGAAAIKNSSSNVTTSLTAGENSSIEVVWIAG